MIDPTAVASASGMPSEILSCPKCQNKMLTAARFCTRCGAAMGNAAALEMSFPELKARQPGAIAPPPSRAPAPLPPPPTAQVVRAAVEPGSPPAASETNSDNSRRNAGMFERSREEVLKRVKAKQDLRGAGLAGIDLTGANLEGVDFGRADFEGAKLDDANLAGAVLTSANLRGAFLRRANLEGAKLTRADLDGADLSDARLSRAHLERASLQSARLERASLVGAVLIRAELTEALLGAADLSHADARQAVFETAVMNGIRLNATKLAGAACAGARITTPTLEWIDVSVHGDGSARLQGDDAIAFLGGRRDSAGPKTRYFGQGDVLRDATLAFDSGSVIHIDSRFENCLITLGEGAELTIGKTGVLSGCEIVGGGRITVHGRFFERSSPGISGARSVVVSSTGGIVGGLQQAMEATVFAFEPGCRLRVKILKPPMAHAAE